MTPCCLPTFLIPSGSERPSSGRQRREPPHSTDYGRSRPDHPRIDRRGRTARAQNSWRARISCVGGTCISVADCGARRSARGEGRTPRRREVFAASITSGAAHAAGQPGSQSSTLRRTHRRRSSMQPSTPSCSSSWVYLTFWRTARGTAGAAAMRAVHGAAGFAKTVVPRHDGYPRAWCAFVHRIGRETLTRSRSRRVGYPAVLTRWQNARTWSGVASRSIYNRASARG